MSCPNCYRFNVILFILFLFQVYEIYNGGALPVQFQFDLTPLDLIRQENFDQPVFECLNPSGEIPPGRSLNIEWRFSPIEAKTYMVSVIVQIGILYSKVYDYRFFILFFYFLAFDFCRFCVVIRFFIPATMANDLRLRKDFLSQILSITFIRL